MDYLKSHCHVLMLRNFKGLAICAQAAYVIVKGSCIDILILSDIAFLNLNINNESDNFNIVSSTCLEKFSK